MGFNFVTSPDNLESPPDAACICLGNSLVTKSETESPPKSLSIMAPMLKTAAAAKQNSDDSNQITNKIID